MTYFTSISHPLGGENFSENLSKFHLFITQTENRRKARWEEGNILFWAAQARSIL